MRGSSPAHRPRIGSSRTSAGAPGSVNSKVDVSCAKGSRLRHVVVSGLKHGWTVKVGRKYTIRYIHEFFGGV